MSSNSPLKKIDLNNNFVLLKNDSITTDNKAIPIELKNESLTESNISCKETIKDSSTSKIKVENKEINDSSTSKIKVENKEINKSISDSKTNSLEKLDIKISQMYKTINKRMNEDIRGNDETFKRLRTRICNAEVKLEYLNKKIESFWTEVNKKVSNPVVPKNKSKEKKLKSKSKKSEPIPSTSGSNSKKKNRYFTKAEEEFYKKEPKFIDNEGKIGFEESDFETD